MTIQARTDSNNEPFALDASAEVVTINLAANQGALTTGAVLGEVTASPGFYVPVDHTAVNGSQLPKLILATPDVADSASATADLSAYSAGLFDENQLVFGGTTDIDSRLVIQTNIDLTMRDALRMFGIRVAPAISESGLENS